MRGLTQFRSIAPDLVAAAMSAERFDRAQSVVAEMETVAEQSGLASVVASAQRCRGLLDGRVELLVDAADLLSATAWRVDHVHACQDAAEALARAGVHDRARELADRAASALEAVLAGVPTPQHEAGGRSDAADGPWATVSARELEVVRLVASGATNPEIAEHLCISRRTVESHVSNVMRKLGASNRTQIATIATNRGL
jgi:DNA-binding NarL/FixJ family response regulator